MSLFDLLLAAKPWWRRFRGGHWELVDYDRMLNVCGIEGQVWQPMDRCALDALGYRPACLVQCEHDGVEVQRG